MSQPRRFGNPGRITSFDDGHLATVTQVSPLRIRTRGATTDAPAKKLPAYTPVLTHQVIYLLVEGQLYVLGEFS